MAIKMVREPSETPNINNIDDIVPMRYAYGNQNGYVIGKGNEISNTVNGLNFTVNSGRLVLQGVECDIDAVGVTITIDNIATKRYYVIYLEVNLGLNSVTIKSEYDTATYPTIDAGDDLTENTTGVARLPLYRFTATSGIISDVNKLVESIKYINENFIKNVKVNDSSKINNIEIIKDENGTLKVGDNIIPQKKLIWEGALTNSGSDDYVSLILPEDAINLGDTLFIESDAGYEKWILNIANNIISGAAYSTYAAYDSLIENTYGAFTIFTTQIGVHPVPSNNSVEIRLHKKVQLRFDFLTTGILDASESSIYVGIPVSVNRIYKIIE